MAGPWLGCAFGVACCVVYRPVSRLHSLVKQHSENHLSLIGKQALLHKWSCPFVCIPNSHAYAGHPFSYPKGTVLFMCTM